MGIKAGCSAGSELKVDWRCHAASRAAGLRGLKQRLRRDIRTFGKNNSKNQKQAKRGSKGACERRLRLKRGHQPDQPRQLFGYAFRLARHRPRGCAPSLRRKNSRNSPAAAFHAASAPATGATTRSCSRFRSCWLQVIGQKTLHLLPRIKQARPHRADVALHHLRNFLMRQALHIMQHDDQSMVF